ncbi:hypothetical protein [uncultured Roseobacter sp.]|uniref:hypothetical protein n=1 Tax=uncultured Roseobacter sp. TaxID=114847 RepID=UPI00262580F6|nr:hypothetical protein [uncultured Roseobacter sp.]
MIILKKSILVAIAERRIVNDPTEENVILGLLLSERKLSSEFLMKVLVAYMQWYTFFFTANLISIGWLVSNDQMRTEILRPDVFFLPGVALSALWILLCTIASAGSMLTVNYMQHAANNLSRMEKNIRVRIARGTADSNHQDDATNISSIDMPRRLFTYTGYANATSTVLSGAFWLGVMLLSWRF